MAELEQKYIQDKEGTQVLPITHTDSVRDSNGNTVTSLLGSMNSRVTQMGNTVSNMSTRVQSCENKVVNNESRVISVDNKNKDLQAQIGTIKTNAGGYYNLQDQINNEDALVHSYNSQVNNVVSAYNTLKAGYVVIVDDTPEEPEAGILYRKIKYDSSNPPLPIGYEDYMVDTATNEFIKILDYTGNATEFTNTVSATNIVDISVLNNTSYSSLGNAVDALVLYDTNHSTNYAKGGVILKYLDSTTGTAKQFRLLNDSWDGNDNYWIENNISVGNIIGDPVDDWEPSTAEKLFQDTQNQLYQLWGALNSRYDGSFPGLIGTITNQTPDSGKAITSGRIYNMLYGSGYENIMNVKANQSDFVTFTADMTELFNNFTQAINTAVAACAVVGDIVSTVA